MVDMLVRCGAKDKTDFVFFDTGLEYGATKEHLDDLEKKYGVEIIRTRPSKSIPTSCKEYGSPFWGKFVSEMIYRLQNHNFKWEDEPFDVLYKRYPNCKVALEWWCNITKGNTTQYVIKRNPYLKEFMVENPPTFKISGKCCDYAKKKLSERFVKENKCDLICVGIRRAEGGIRAGSHKTCFSEWHGTDYFMPIFWFSDQDKEEYCKHYGVLHSKCYSQYGLVRTGCFGCPFGKRFEEELRLIERFEPNLIRAANNIFGESYEYTRKYLEFRNKMKRKMSVA